MIAHRTRAFTLLELLVATALTLAIAAIMLVVTRATLELWRRTQDRFTTAAQAQLALDLIERDFQAAVFRRDGAARLAVTITNDAVLLTARGWLIAPRIKPATSDSLALRPDLANGRTATIAAARFGVSGAWLRLFAAVPETTNDATVQRAIAYQIVRRPVSGAVTASNPAAVRYALFRTAVSAVTTFMAGPDVTSAAYGSALANPSTGNDLLATNVVDFGVWLYVRETNGALRRIFPADAADFTHVARDAGAAADGERLPEVADVMIRLVDDEGARQLAAVEQGLVARPATFASDAAWWWSVVESHSTVFVRRIEMKGGAR